MRFRSLPAALLAVPLVTAGLLAAPQASAQQRITVGMPVPWAMQYGYIPFGEKLGFFRDEGFTLNRIAVTGSAVLLPQVAAGQVTFGFANPDLPVIAASRNEALPLRFVMNWLQSSTFEFAVLPESPIQTLADLKGRKLGVGALTWGNLPLSRAMLASVGVVWQRDVQVLPVGLGAAAWRRLQTGEVDALNLFVSEHERMAIAGIAFRRVPMPEPFRSIFSNGWVASDRTIAEQPQQVIGFGRALVRSWLACKANAEACVKAMWEAEAPLRPAPGQGAARLAADLRLVLADGPQIDDFAPNGPRLYGAYPPGSWERLIGVMHAEGQISHADLPLDRLVTDRFVTDINRIDIPATEAAGRAAR
jgi:NitT/TauT family transport system substrate-binding protein